MEEREGDGGGDREREKKRARQRERQWEIKNASNNECHIFPSSIRQLQLSDTLKDPPSEGEGPGAKIWRHYSV